MKPGAGKTPFVKSFKYAIQGVIEAYRTGFNIRVQTAGAVLVIVLGFVFSLAPWEWCAVLICCGLVIGGECVNSAIEDAVDLASPELHPVAKAAKDMAAGAVYIFAFTSAIVGCIVFIPHVLPLLGW